MKSKFRFVLYFEGVIFDGIFVDLVLRLIFYIDIGYNVIFFIIIDGVYFKIIIN